MCYVYKMSIEDLRKGPGGLDSRFVQQTQRALQKARCLQHQAPTKHVELLLLLTPVSG